MKARHLVLLVAVLVQPRHATAQTASNRVVGTWKGDIGLTSSNRTTITMELKVDEKSAVTGTAASSTQNAVVRAGSYDSTTGSLHLELDVADDTAPRKVIFDGLLVGDVMAGKVTVNTQTGTFGFARGGGAPSDASLAAVRKQYTDVSELLLKSAELVPAARYTYRPVATVRTFGELIAHAADELTYFCANAQGQNAKWSDALEKGTHGKVAIVAALRTAQAGCVNAHASGGVEPLTENLQQASLHYGNVITYLRMMGLKPPSN